MLLVIGYFITLILFSLYSFVLLDPNITFLRNDAWTNFRNTMVQIGYYNRPLSLILYISFLVLLFIFHFYFMKRYKNFRPIGIATGVAIITLFSYPFLSHDFFNYMFDAKILTFYHANPYLHRALDYPLDPWIRFMHWTHRTYPYGPTFLLFSLIPSLLSAGKFLIDYIFFKGMFALFYVVGVGLLAKQSNKWALFIATNPLIIVEGLVSSHNDLIALMLALIGGALVLKDRNIFGRVLILLSGGIKYITLPFLFILKKNSRWNVVVCVGVVTMILYLSLFMEVQPWYFLNLLIFVPFYFTFISRLNIFFAGLLLSYMPYILWGEWGAPEKLLWKHAIILTAMGINSAYLLFLYYKEIHSGLFSIHRSKVV